MIYNNVSTSPRANAVLRQAKKLVLTSVLKFVPIDLDQATFISVTDASFAGQPKGSSQMGLAVLMSTGKILEGSDTANMIEWSSKKIHRVVKSTFCRRGSRDELRVRQDVLRQGSLHRDHVRMRPEVARRAPNHSTGPTTHG